MFPRKRNPKPIVLIKWLDAHGDNLTYTDEDLSDDAGWPTVTTGFLVKSDSAGVTLATDIQLPYGDSKKNSYHGRHFIPRGMIIEEVVIKS